MVGDDHVEADLARVGDLGVSADPAVDGDDQADAGRGELVERLGGDAVAVGEAVGQAPDHVGAHVDAQELAEQERGGDAVGVVVAVHGDRLAAAEGAIDALARLGHAVEQVRAVDAKVGVQELVGGSRVGEPSAREDLGGEPADLELVGKQRGDAQVDGPICQVCSLIAAPSYRRRQTEAPLPATRDGDGGATPGDQGRRRRRPGSGLPQHTA